MKDEKLTRHHKIPRSVGGLSTKDNIVVVSHGEHDKYHQLFSNKTPIEIIHYLVTVFWGGDTSAINDYLDEIDNNKS